MIVNLRAKVIKMNKQDVLILSIAEQIGFVLVSVCFPGNTNSYTYKALASENVEAGDSVVVLTPREGYKIATVQEVKTSDFIDLSVPFDYKWIIQKVDTTNYKAIEEREAKLRQVLASAQLRKQREELLAIYKEELGENLLKEVAAIAEIKFN